MIVGDAENFLLPEKCYLVWFCVCKVTKCVRIVLCCFKYRRLEGGFSSYKKSYGFHTLSPLSSWKHHDF